MSILPRPFELTEDEIQRNVSGALAGAYALGFLDPDVGFLVKFVGQSDDDLRRKLLMHSPEQHPEFCFSYCQNEDEPSWVGHRALRTDSRGATYHLIPALTCKEKHLFVCAL